MRKKSVVTGLVLTLCFVMQMGEALGSERRASTSATPPRRGSSEPAGPFALDTSQPLPDQIQQIEQELSKELSALGLNPKWILRQRTEDGQQKSLTTISQEHNATFQQAEEGVKKTYKYIGKNLPGYDDHVRTRDRLEPIVRTLKNAVTFEKTRIKPLQDLLQGKRAELATAQRLESERQEAADRKRKEDEEEREHQEAERKRIADEEREAQELSQKVAELRAKHLAERATAIQTKYREHLVQKKAKQEKDLLTHTIGWLGGATRAEDLPKDSREARLVGWTGSSYNVFNQTESTYDKMAAEYGWVRGKLNADQYGVLYDLAVSYRAHTNLSDSHADNNWIIKSREIDPDSDLPGAVKLVRRCTDVLKGKDVTNDGVLKAISDMAADTLVTGGRIGIDLHRQATEVEMAVMIPALRQRGAIALQLAKDNNITEALEAVAKTFLDAAFKKESPASPNRKAIYDKDRFNSHKAHCFIAAARGAKKDWDEAFEQQVLGKLTDRSMAGMTQAYIKSTKEYYDGFDN